MKFNIDMKVYIEKLTQGGGSQIGRHLETTRRHGMLIFAGMQEDTHTFHLKKLEVASPSECRVLIRNVHGPPFIFVCFLTVSPLLRTPPLTQFLNKCFHIALPGKIYVEKKQHRFASIL